jgi:hypothetical protein
VVDFEMLRLLDDYQLYLAIDVGHCVLKSLDLPSPDVRVSEHTE